MTTTFYHDDGTTCTEDVCLRYHPMWETPADAGACPATWAGGHALVIESGDGMITAHCECGEPFGRGIPTTSLDHFGMVWAHHMATRQG